MTPLRNMFEHYAAGEKLYTSTVAPVCEAHELTYMEFTILLFLANNPQFDTASHVVSSYCSQTGVMSLL